MTTKSYQDKGYPLATKTDCRLTIADSQNICTCTRCKKEYSIPSYQEDLGFCDECYILVAKALFNKDNDNLKVKELRENLDRGKL